MTESYSDLYSLFQNQVETRVFTCIDNSSGKYHNVDKADVIAFYKHYCDTCFGKDFICWNENPILTISEKIEKHVPVIGDFILKFLEGSENMLNDKLINEIVLIYQDVIRKTFDLSNNLYETICIFMKSQVWYEQGKPCYRLRFQFPFCRTKSDIINSVINGNIINLLEKNPITSVYSEQIERGWNGALKDIGAYITMYGSTDNPKFMPPVLFNSVFAASDDSRQCNVISLTDVYNYQKHSFIVKDKCDTEDISIIEDDCDIEDDYTFALYTLPIFLSIYYHPENCKLKELDAESDTSSVIIEEDEDDEELNLKTDLDMCNELVKHLPPKRFNNKTYFLDIGKAYYSATDGSYKGLIEWSKCCNRSKEFNKDFCEQYYDTFENEKVTYRTLGWYFKIDNKKKYNIWHTTWCEQALVNSISDRTHTLIGESFYRCYWLKYMYTGKKWYEFRRNRLIVIQEEKLKQIIKNDFIPNFDNISAATNSEILKLNARMKIGTTKYKKAHDELQERMSNIQKIKKLLQNVPFISCILKSIQSFFYYEDINKVMDLNPNILGCSNCVIELTDEKAFKRDGKPEDFVTKKIGVPYRSDYSFDHPDVKDIIKYLTQVFPVKDIREYMYKDLASMLYRRNSEKLWRVWMGTTNGSKSILQKMVTHWLGDYTCLLPQEVYSGKKMSTSGPTPELAQAENAAVAFTSEPDDDIPFIGPRIKALTGGDGFYARGCGENGGAIDATFKAIAVMNIVPSITSLDEATMNRIMMIPFEGRWIKPEEKKNFKLKDTFEEQIREKIYEMDPRFETNIPRLAQALNWLCIQNFKKYRREGLEKPAYIDKYMADYWSKNDPCKVFIEENLEIPRKEDGTLDDTKYVTKTDLYPVYKKWFKSNYTNYKIVEPAKFVILMSDPARLGKQGARRRWYGYSIKQQEENKDIF